MTWHADDTLKLGQLINDWRVIDGQQALDVDIMHYMLIKGGHLGLRGDWCGVVPQWRNLLSRQ